MFRILYDDKEVLVTVLQFDEWDDYQPYLLQFPKGHPMYEPDGVWIPAQDYTILERGDNLE